MIRYSKIYLTSWLNILNIWGRATRRDTIVFAIGTCILFLTYALGSYYLQKFAGIDIVNFNSKKEFSIFGIIRHIKVIDIPMFLFLICCLTLSVRRFHDTGQSGFIWFMYFVPVIGQLSLFFDLFIARSNSACDDDIKNNRFAKYPYQFKY